MFYRRTVIITEDGYKYIGNLANNNARLWEPYKKEWVDSHIEEVSYEDYPLIILTLNNGVEIHSTLDQIYKDKLITDLQRGDYVDYVEDLPDCGRDYSRKTMEDVSTTEEFPITFLRANKESKLKLNKLVETVQPIYFRWYAFPYSMYLTHIGIKTKIVSDRFVFHHDRHYHDEIWIYKYLPLLEYNDNVEINKVSSVLTIGTYTDKVYKVIGPEYFTLGNGIIAKGHTDDI